MNQDQMRQVAKVIDAKLSSSEKKIVIQWMNGLLKIRSSQQKNAEKLRCALSLTKENSNVIVPIAKIIASELKRIWWDERSWAARLALSGVIAGLLVFGSEGAGIAAFGTAIGVPLWIVLGAGGSFAGLLIEHLSRKAE